MSQHRPILVAEDEETDALILRMAVQQAGIPNPLIITHDGTETLAYLRGEAPFSDRSTYPLPALLILDLKMPALTGFDVLSWLRSRPDFTELPAVVLSSSSHEADVAKAREMGAREFHVKPHSFKELTRLVQELARRWLERSSLPESDAGRGTGA